jgi:hypothetical protein
MRSHLKSVKKVIFVCGKAWNPYRYSANSRDTASKKTGCQYRYFWYKGIIPLVHTNLVGEGDPVTFGWKEFRQATWGVKIQAPVHMGNQTQ